MGGENSFCVIYYLCVFFLFLGPHAKYDDRIISFKNKGLRFVYFIKIFYLYILKIIMIRML